MPTGGIHRHPMFKPANFLFSGIKIILGARTTVGLWGSPPWAETRSIEVLMNMLKIPTKNKSAKLHMIIARLVPSQKFAPWFIASGRRVWDPSKLHNEVIMGTAEDSILFKHFLSTAKYNHHSSWSNLLASLMLSHTFPAENGPRYYKLSINKYVQARSCSSDPSHS